MKALICGMNKKHPSCHRQKTHASAGKMTFLDSKDRVSFLLSHSIVSAAAVILRRACSHQQSSSQSEGRTGPWNILTIEEKWQRETTNFVQISHLAAKIFFKKPAEVIINDFVAIYRRVKNSASIFNKNLSIQSLTG